jgi:titin
MYANFIGIDIGGTNNIIGGIDVNLRNVISGNSNTEIGMKSATGNLVLGNYIGTDTTGTIKLGEPSYFTIIAESASANNQIKSNVIAGRICINDLGSSYNDIIGNFIGTDATGTVSLCDNAYIIVNQPFNKIGGTEPGEGNVINGMLSISQTSDIIVIGNLIGTSASGVEVFTTQGWLITLEAGSCHNFIGGLTEAEKNILNGGKGSTLVHLSGSSDRNFIAGNSVGLDSDKIPQKTFYSGISLESAEYNFIQNNLIYNGIVGISIAYFDFAQSGANFNLIRANLVTGTSEIGIGIVQGKSNIIFSNVLKDNKTNGQDDGINNSWDYDQRGNYWDDYSGKDKDGNGIGDTPYAIKPKGIDNYPLMKPS